MADDNLEDSFPPNDETQDVVYGLDYYISSDLSEQDIIEDLGPVTAKVIVAVRAQRSTATGETMKPRIRRCKGEGLHAIYHQRHGWDAITGIVHQHRTHFLHWDEAVQHALHYVADRRHRF